MFSDPYKTHKYSVWAESGLLNGKLCDTKVITELGRVTEELIRQI